MRPEARPSPAGEVPGPAQARAFQEMRDGWRGSEAVSRARSPARTRALVVSWTSQITPEMSLTWARMEGWIMDEARFAGDDKLGLDGLSYISIAIVRSPLSDGFLLGIASEARKNISGTIQTQVNSNPMLCVQKHSRGSRQ